MQTLAPGKTINTDYGSITIKKHLNNGMMAVSYEAENDKGETILFKVYKQPVPHEEYCSWHKQYERLQREVIRRLEKAPDFLIQTLGFFEYDGSYCQVIEWAEGRPLEDILQDLHTGHDMDRAMKIARVMLFGIKEMHRVGIVHEDLKPDNVWLNEDPSIGLGYRVKICDFDWSFPAGEKLPWDPVGTPGYSSPEHLHGRVPTKASDMFTAGIILYELFAGVHPLQPVIQHATTPEERDEAIRRAVENRTIPPMTRTAPDRAKALPGKVLDAISRCFDPAPDKRPTAEEMHRILTATPASGASPHPATPPAAHGPSPGASPASGASPPPGRAPCRLALKHAATGLTWRIMEPTDFTRRFCTQMFNIEAGHVSRRQGQFSCNPEKTKWFIEHDPNATNATMVDGVPITGRTELTPGTKLQVGNPATGNIVFELEVTYEPI